MKVKTAARSFEYDFPCVDKAIDIPFVHPTSVNPGFVSVRRVLIVDDNESAALMLQKLLLSLGHNVETASSGDQALATAERFHPELIFMDLGMPHMNGFEVCQRIREQPWGQKIRIIALTGWGQEGDRRRTREAQFDEHFVKPIQVSDLQKLLARV